MLSIILISINLYLTYKLAEFSGAISTKRNSMTDNEFERMRQKAIDNFKVKHNITKEGVQ